MFRATAVRLAKKMMYHPNCEAEEAKALALVVVKVLQEHKALTTEELWHQVKMQGDIRTKRYMKKLLRWMKQEKIVYTMLPFKQAESRVFKLVTAEADGGEQLDVDAAVDAAAQRIEPLPEDPKQDFNRVWLRFAPRATISRDALRRRANEERRGRAPLMPFWDI